MARTINHVVAFEERRAAIERTRGRLRKRADGRSLVDELIAERRAEARADAPTEPAQQRRHER